MTPMHPITGAVVASTVAQRAQAEDKAQHLRRLQQNQKDTPTADIFEPQVQSPDELHPVADEPLKRQSRPRRDRRRNRREPAPPDDSRQGLDITA
ncbi:MAG: hypothetical protein NZ561_07710 [Phycisphaerae bacterium]|nr:hypothetical protein [Phycisphaerae bacterium]MDW8261167.1 hypothetical protein [Phycisphaerales bacterium]